VDYDVKLYGSAVLKQPAVPVARVDDAIRQLAKDMLRAMYRHNGLGLAAQQIGRREAICVLDVPARRQGPNGADIVENPEVPMPLVLLNPRITAQAGSETAQEGCLSFPDIYVAICRPRQVTVEFMNLEGAAQALTVVGLLARAVLHEIDHLNGVLLVDRMSTAQRVALAGKLRRLKRSATT